MDLLSFEYFEVFSWRDKAMISMLILMTISSRDRDILLPAHSQAHDEKHTVTDISTAPTAADIVGIMTIWRYSRWIIILKYMFSAMQ